MGLEGDPYISMLRAGIKQCSQDLLQRLLELPALLRTLSQGETSVPVMPDSCDTQAWLLRLLCITGGETRSIQCREEKQPKSTETRVF